MFQVSTLLATVLLALAVSSTPVTQIREPNLSLPFTLRLNVSGSTLPELDRARAANLKSKAGKLDRRQSSFDVTNVAVVYSADVGVGTPPTTYSLLIDTGSSNTWVGAGKSFVRTSSSVSSGRRVSVTYGSGSFSGTEWTDTVTLSSDLVVTGQGVGVASSSSGFSGFDGILGIGPVDLTEGTVSGVSSVPTVTDNLLSQGTISEEVIGVYFAPTTSEETTNGELTFGGIDSSRISGSVSYTSITSTSPARDYWGINESITYGSSRSNVLSSTAGIVDTGTTLVLIASDAFSRYRSLTGATEDASTGLLRITTANYANLQSLFFNIGSQSYEFTKNAQTWPRSLNTAIGGSSSAIYLIVADLGSSSGEGLDFINGYTFLERYYSVFDTTNNRVGFASTAHTSDTTN
ncbi:acid protease [Pyrrhoderma noxium]|uniref:Acid protease n=1 Tax=Pyrrhoderma noxium TaxID=2282107 RepID=A0A286U5P5_9AGAM|nr:acid protease [Pyrrhoderma noxium]